MTKYLALAGLILDILGAGILIRDELTSLAANIQQCESSLSGRCWHKAAYSLARRFGSKDPLARESFIGESFTMRFWGFVFLIFGFLCQALAVVFQ